VHEYVLSVDQVGHGGHGHSQAWKELHGRSFAVMSEQPRKQNKKKFANKICRFRELKRCSRGSQLVSINGATFTRVVEDGRPGLYT
jgi:hypothetical protein